MRMEPRRSRSLTRALALAALAPTGALAQAPAEAPQRAPERRAADASEPASWSFDLSARGDVGYDTNVFQTDSPRGDSFSRLGGVASAELENGRDRLRGRAQLRRKFYWELSQADELEGSLDVTASRDLGALLTGVGLSSDYLDLRLLDREGNLLPRATFASFSNRLLAFADLRVIEDLYLAAETGLRIKDYEETEGLGSLDYGEWSAEAGLTRYLPGRVSVRVLGSWDERDYQERRAADAAGFLNPDNPELRLRRLEGEARLRKRWGEEGLLQLVLAVRKSRDLFEDELTYGQRSATLRARHAVAGWLLSLRAGLVGRDFERRRSGSGEPLEEDFLTFEAELERALWPGARAAGGYQLYRRSTNDASGGYTVGTFQLGIVHVF
jgi:hypothetical protein